MEYNSDIKIEGQPSFYKSWYKAGINKVKHLLHYTLYYSLLSSIKEMENNANTKTERQVVTCQHGHFLSRKKRHFLISIDFPLLTFINTGNFSVEILGNNPRNIIV